MTQKYKTNEDIKYYKGWTSKFILIPKGSAVYPATNLPEGSGFWLKELPKDYWEDFTAIDWHTNYGILIEKEQVEVA
jgi:hypothetical protein